MNDKPRIITPNGGHDRKVVGIDNKPIKQVDDALTKDHETQTQENIIVALREIADKLEDGTLPRAKYIMVVPSFENGETQLLFLGDPVPNVMLEGMLHRLLTKMAMA